MTPAQRKLLGPVAARLLASYERTRQYGSLPNLTMDRLTYTAKELSAPVATDKIAAK